MTPDFLREFDFFVGVPDSQLRGFCDYLMGKYGADGIHHIIAANEGNAVGLAAGYHLATGKVPVVYLQNSGLGNIANPVASLLHEKVYGIPCLFVVGWRGEPGVRDEPQHAHQGEITLSMLKDLGIASFIIGPETSRSAAERALEDFRTLFSQGKSAAFVVRKGTFGSGAKTVYTNANALSREDVIRAVVDRSGCDPVVSTTGKTSRELFEIREQRRESHQYDFLTVGSMGHASSIALGIALNNPGRRVWCLDGDGASLMHMGSLAITGSSGAKNLIHIVINNEAHESVGGMPTAARRVNLPAIASACGYLRAASAGSIQELDAFLAQLDAIAGPALLEVRCAIGSRPDLGRPTIAPQANKDAFMAHLRNRESAL